MQRSSGVAVALVVGLAAIVAPLFVSLQLARNQSISSEKQRVAGYAQDALRRTSELADELGSALQKLKNAHDPACSPQEVDLMRKIDVSSSYIQAVGHIDGNNLTCTSLGTIKPIPVGPPDLVTVNGLTERLHVKAFSWQPHALVVVSENGYAFVIDPSLLIDTPTEGPDISVALFTPSSLKHDFFAARSNKMLEQWHRSIPAGTAISFIDSGYLVEVIRSANMDVAAVAAVPQSYVERRVREFAMIFVPIGLLCGGGLVWAVTYIAQVNLALPAVLRAAARRREFYVEYQPIVELESQRVVGAEALVRWQRSGRVVRPDQFIPTAEASGVITLITERVAAIVAADLPKLTRLSPSFCVALNLSAQDLRTERTVRVLERVLAVSGALPSNLEIEATERGFLQGIEARELLAKIRALGISVAIDDFGTGYSSLACLQTLGLDTLKIDKAFVDTIGTDGATSQVVVHIIEMARSLELDMVGEGVETEAQAEFLKARGVHYAQGWLFGRPMALASLCEMLEKQNTRRG